MKIKYISAIFVYFATFTLSVLMVGLPASINRSSKSPCVKSAPIASAETDLQVRLRKFLEADQQTGIEFANDLTRLSASNSRLNAEKIATLNLVEKMRKVECGAGMPKGFCLAWIDHAYAWQLKAEFLNKDFKNNKFSEAETAEYEYRKLNERIGKTYQAMLEQARREGVDFKY